MKITRDENITIIEDFGEFDLAATFDGGQAFRWKKVDEKWQGIAYEHWVKIYKAENQLIIETCHQQDFDDIWYDYLDLGRDYSKIYSEFRNNVHLQDAINTTPGLRILNQPEFECLISFIISANNNIKRIRSIIERICINYGREILKGVYTFPTAKELSLIAPEVFKELGAGYRAPYISKTAKAVYDGFPLDGIKNMDVDTARERLKELLGVGEKVANCVLLFSCKHRTAFPVDTWIKKAIANIFKDCPTDNAKIRNMVIDTFGTEAGLAQQYLFHNERIKSGKK